jgi:large subunit ribosomal protein L28
MKGQDKGMEKAMARRCAITGKDVMSGNKVSHSNRKTRRRFLPNMQNVTFRSSVLGDIHMRVSANAVRTVEHRGGIDAYLLETSNARLSADALSLKKRLQKAMSATA